MCAKFELATTQTVVCMTTYRCPHTHIQTDDKSQFQRHDLVKPKSANKGVKKSPAAQRHVDSMAEIGKEEVKLLILGQFTAGIFNICWQHDIVYTYIKKVNSLLYTAEQYTVLANLQGCRAVSS